MRNPLALVIRSLSDGLPRVRRFAGGWPRARALAVGVVLAMAATMLPPATAEAAEVPTTKETEKPSTTPGAKKKKKLEPRAKRKRAPAVSPKALAEAASASSSHDLHGQSPRLSPFPREAAAVAKAFAEHRRDEISDAEKSAREPGTKDRWRTVLFYLRDLQSRPDPEACFWRVLAFYRLGELGRARRIREDCELAPRDRAALDEEDVTAAGLQPAWALPELRLPEENADSNPVAPVENTAAYSGPSPTPVK